MDLMTMQDTSFYCKPEEIHPPRVIPFNRYYPKESYQLYNTPAPAAHKCPFLLLGYEPTRKDNLRGMGYEKLYTEGVELVSDMFYTSFDSHPNT
jgi:hypothetical protein